MKAIKKMLSFMLAVVMMMAMTVTAGATGTHSITINNTKAGYVYEAYQVFAGDLSDGVLSNITWGAGVNGEALLAALKSDSDTAATYASCATAAQVADKLTEGNAKAFAAVAAKNLSANVAGSVTIAANQTSGTIGSLDAGYYLVKDENGSVGTNEVYTAYILKVVGTATVNAKITQPTLNKEIKHNDDNSWGKVGDNQIGDTVEFRTITTVPDTTHYTNYIYKITDTMSTGLTSNVKSAADVTIKVNDTTTLDAAYYTVEATGNTFVVTVDVKTAIADGVMAAGNTLYTYYTGTLNTDALTYDEGKQDNVAKLTYSNNPNNSGTGIPGTPNQPEEGKDDVTETPEVKVYDWTFKLNVTKVDAAVSTKKLAGAEFVLKTEAGSQIKVTKVSEGVYKVDPTNGTTDAMVTPANGEIAIKGLDDTVTYLLEETKAPAGYNLLAEAVRVKIGASYSEDGATYTNVTVNGTQGNGITVENNAGATLPATGGMGTTVFNVVGGMLMVIAAVLLITRKRLSVNR